jgi:hypothetical protein
MKTMYLRKQGGLTFWRIGRLGGSFYVARRPQAQTWRIETTAYGPSLHRVRSIGDLGGVALAALYGSSAALGMGMAALAMWH